LKCNGEWKIDNGELEFSWELITEEGESECNGEWKIDNGELEFSWELITEEGELF
jgi:hypothetical protein